MEMSDYLSHYLPISDLAMKWGFYLTGGGKGTIAPGAPYPSTSHPSLYQLQWNRGRILPEFQLICVTDGNGVFESKETSSVQVETNSIILLFPGVWHRYRPNPKSGWTERWIGFHGDISHRLITLGILTPDKPVWKLRNTEAFIKTFDRLLDSINPKRRRNPIEISFRTMSLLAEATASLDGKLLSVDAENRGQLGDVADSLVSDASELIWTHSHRFLSVQQLAKQLKVARRTLDRRFREALGRSVLDEITYCRVSRAKRLLVETTLPMKSIAHLAGFPNAGRMRVVFLTREGLSPTTLRDASRKA
jgi:AraC-like DNA-binding protein